MKTMGITFGILAVILFFLGAFAGYLWGAKFTPPGKDVPENGSGNETKSELSENEEKILQMYNSPVFDHLNFHLVGRITKKGNSTIFLNYRDSELALPITQKTDFKKIVQPEGEKSRIKPMNPNHVKRGDQVILLVTLTEDEFYIKQLTRQKAN